MYGRNQLTTDLESTDHGQVEVLVSNSRVETTNEVRLHTHNLAIIIINGTRWKTICIVVTGIFHLDHTRLTTRLQNIESSLFALLPNAFIFPVVNHIDRIANKPTVTLITLLTRRKLCQLVAVLIEVNTSRPVPTVLVVNDDAVQSELPTLVLSLTDVTGITAYTSSRRQ